MADDYKPSKKLELLLLDKLIKDTMEDYTNAKRCISYIFAIGGEERAKTFYRKPYDKPLNHPVHGEVSLLYVKYLYYKKQLPIWEEELKGYLAREEALLGDSINKEVEKVK